MHITEMVHQCKNITVGLTDQEVVEMRDWVVHELILRSTKPNLDKYWMARVEGFLDMPPSYPLNNDYWRMWAFCERRCNGFDAIVLVQAKRWRATRWKKNDGSRVPTDG